jgi:hypothetical protein
VLSLNYISLKICGWFVINLIYKFVDLNFVKNFDRFHKRYINTNKITTHIDHNKKIKKINK